MKRFGLWVAAIAVTFFSVFGVARFAPTIFGDPSGTVARMVMPNPGQYAAACPEEPFDGKCLYAQAYRALRDWHITLADPAKAQEFAQWEHRFDNTDDLKTEEGTDRAIRMMRDSLGQRFDFFLTREGTKDEQRQVRSDLVGIGVPVGLRDMKSLVDAIPKPVTRQKVEAASVISTGHELEIGEPMEGGPAFGVLRKGDLIVAVDGQSINGLTLQAAVDRIRGVAGTKVDITVIRQENGQPVNHTFTFTRAPVARHAVHYSERDGKAIIKVDDFMAENVADDFAAAVQRANERNVGIVFDLRNNGGGNLALARDMLMRIIPRGTLYVQVERMGGTPIVMYDETAVATSTALQIRRLPNQEPRIRTGERAPLILRPSKPIVVVINEGSASASEIFAGAVQGNHRGTVVGRPSIGKGVGQLVVPLPFGRSMHITTFEFLPAGMKSDWIGVIPDVEVAPATPEQARNGQDPQIDAALADIDRQIAAARTRAARAEETSREHHTFFDCRMQLEHEIDALPVGSEPSEELVRRMRDCRRPGTAAETPETDENP